MKTLYSRMFLSGIAGAKEIDLHEKVTKMGSAVICIGPILTKSEGGMTTTSKMTTCYEPYDYDGVNESDPVEEPNLTDKWGLVIHKPIVGRQFAANDFYGRYRAEQNIKQGYGIKCLHPKYLAKVTSLTELPKELVR